MPAVPTNDSKYKTSALAQAAVSTTPYTDVEAGEKTWKFVSWDNGEVDEENHKVTFTGTWTSAEYQWTVQYRWDTNDSDLPKVPEDNRKYKNEAAARNAKSRRILIQRFRWKPANGNSKAGTMVKLTRRT